jgi:hypothetical protein
LEVVRYPLGLEVSPCPKGVFLDLDFLNSLMTDND